MRPLLPQAFERRSAGFSWQFDGFQLTEAHEGHADRSLDRSGMCSLQPQVQRSSVSVCSVMSARGSGETGQQVRRSSACCVPLMNDFKAPSRSINGCFPEPPQPSGAARARIGASGIRPLPGFRQLHGLLTVADGSYLKPSQCSPANSANLSLPKRLSHGNSDQRLAPPATPSVKTSQPG